MIFGLSEGVIDTAQSPWMVSVRPSEDSATEWVVELSVDRLGAYVVASSPSRAEMAKLCRSVLTLAQSGETWVDFQDSPRKWWSGRKETE